MQAIVATKLLPNTPDISSFDDPSCLKIQVPLITKVNPAFDEPSIASTVINEGSFVHGDAFRTVLERRALSLTKLKSLP